MAGRLKVQLTRFARRALNAVIYRYRRRGNDAWLALAPWRRLNDSGLFDAAWYTSSYPVALSSGMHPLRRYVERGAALGADPNPFFSTTWYRSAYPDVERSGINPCRTTLTTAHLRVAIPGRSSTPPTTTQRTRTCKPRRSTH